MKRAKLIDFEKELTKRTKDKALDVLLTCAECPNGPINRSCKACPVFKDFFRDLNEEDLDFLFGVIEGGTT